VSPVPGNVALPPRRVAALPGNVSLRPSRDRYKITAILGATTLPPAWILRTLLTLA